MIYHITTPDLHAKFNALDYYEAPSLQLEGFIHCSTLAQLKATAERYYSEVPEIMVYHIDENLLNSELKYEMATIGESFPHIYGSINKNAIVSIQSYPNHSGSFDIKSE